MYKKWTIILVPFPFTDLSGSKVRPAILISHNLKGDDVVVLFLSSQKGKRDPFDVLLSPSQKNGLKVPSLVRCAKIATLDKKIILGELGRVDDVYQGAIDVRLRKLFSL